MAEEVEVFIADGALLADRAKAVHDPAHEHGLDHGSLVLLLDLDELVDDPLDDPAGVGDGAKVVREGVEVVAVPLHRSVLVHLEDNRGFSEADFDQVVDTRVRRAHIAQDVAELDGEHVVHLGTELVLVGSQSAVDEVFDDVAELFEVDQAAQAGLQAELGELPEPLLLDGEHIAEESEPRKGQDH